MIGEKMKFKGAKLTGTSLLMMLGCLCLVAVLVAAAYAFTATITYNDQSVISNPSIGISGLSVVGTKYTGQLVGYTFTATPNIACSLTAIDVTVSKDGGYASGDVKSSTVDVCINSVAYTVSLNGAGVGSLTLPTPAALGAQAYAGSTIELTYAVSGNYDVSVVLHASAADAT